MLSKEERIKLIKQIEEKTNSKVLVYFTGDRQGLETRISHDVIPIISKHISKFNSDRISLFIYTPGGITVAGYGIVNLIREHCKELHFIIPYKCLSTGTLMALGGNSIMMSKMAQLGPVDPSTQHPLAPSVPISQNPTVPVSVPVNVEDVMSYFDLAKAQCNISTQDNLTEIFISIAEKRTSSGSWCC